MQNKEINNKPITDTEWDRKVKEAFLEGNREARKKMEAQKPKVIATEQQQKQARSAWSQIKRFIGEKLGREDLEGYQAKDVKTVIKDASWYAGYKLRQRKIMKNYNRYIKSQNQEEPTSFSLETIGRKIKHTKHKSLS